MIFPDDWTLVTIPGRQPSSDSWRYKAIGNSMVVPVVRFIGQQILLAEQLNDNSTLPR